MNNGFYSLFSHKYPLFILFFLRDGVEFTCWDRWDVHGDKEYRLKDLVDYFKVTIF